MDNEILVGRTVLENGLRVVSVRNPSAAMATVDVLYNTGARDEDPDRTGIAHLFEHLMFSGSVNVPDFDAVVEDAGGTNNAWTNNDFTNFYDIMPVQNVETAFYLESDRMLGLAFRPESLEIQRNVVIEEFKQRMNQPYADTEVYLRRMIYGDSHPYGWPTIGKTPQHIADATSEDMHRWFYSHYAPDNAVLAVVGDLEHEKVVELARKWFGDLPRRNPAPRALSAPRFPQRNVRETVYGRVPQTVVTIAFPVGAYVTDECECADIITDILADGRASRYYRRFVAGGDDSPFVEADASITGSEHEGMLILTGVPASEDDETVALVERLLLEEARKLAVPGNLAPDELERTFNRYEYTFRSQNLAGVSLAQNIALAEMHGEDINARMDRRRRFTVDDIAAAADSIFNHRAFATLVYRPSDSSSEV